MNIRLCNNIIIEADGHRLLLRYIKVFDIIE